MMIWLLPKYPLKQENTRPWSWKNTPIKSRSAENPNSYIINVSRGSIIDEKILTKYLVEKKIAGAALDVFEQEPLDKKSNLFSIENVILGSHNGNNTSCAVEFVHQNTINHLTNFFNND